MRTVCLARQASSSQNEAQKQSFLFSAQANALPVALGDKPGHPSPASAPWGVRGEAGMAR